MTGSADARTRITDVLDRTAARHPTKLAIVSGEQRLTWAEVRERSELAARALLASGLRPGDHIALWLPNRPEWLLLWLGAMRIGVTAIPVNTKYKSAEAEYVLRKSDARIVFMERQFLGIDYLEMLHEICSERVDGIGCTPLPELRYPVVVGGAEDQLSLEAFLDGARDVPEQQLQAVHAGVSADADVIIVFTSGTTGFPKGVVHTHAVVEMVETVSRWLDLGPEDRILGHMPLFHVAGVFSSFMLAVVCGGALVQMDQWDVVQALELIEQERISVLSGVPTHFVDLLNSPQLARTDLSSLRTGWLGGAYIPADVFRGAREILGMDSLVPVYGMTECTSSTTLGRPTDPIDSLARGRGVPLGGYEVAIVDPESRTQLPLGLEGEVAVRGYLVMKEYYKEPEATAAVLDSDGWFYTGDLGVIDGDGYLSITGRRSAMLIVGGNNVHPADIERVLISCDGVKAACVVARSHLRLGEVPVAFIELADGTYLSEQDIIGWARQRLASFKVPRQVVFVREWPTTSTGKVDTSKLRRHSAVQPTKELL